MYEGPERLTPHFGPRRRQSFTSNAVRAILGHRWFAAVLLIALFINIALWLFIALRFPGLNELLPLHFDALGYPDRIESKNGIFVLPTIGLVVLLTNAGMGLVTQTRERAAALVLAASATLVELMLWVVTLNIVGGIS